MTALDKAGLHDRMMAAVADYKAMSPERRKAHDQAQRESWVRSMTARCEHGMADFEQCGECRAAGQP